jgi:hypothetical protein
MSETMTTGCSLGAICSPWWLPSLDSISHVFGALLPVLGVILLTSQLIDRFNRKRVK